VLGDRGADGLMDQLVCAPSWEARFAILDRLLVKRLASGPGFCDVMAPAWRRLRECSGRISVATLAHDVGVSTRSLEQRFAEQIGQTPKMMARILRLWLAAQLANNARRGSLATIATRCGYADQAHLNRDFRMLAGQSPRELRAVRPVTPVSARFFKTPEPSAGRLGAVPVHCAEGRQ
jgi:AraC-like DNA-binding protein